MDPRTAQRRDCQPATESDATQTNNTASILEADREIRPIKIRHQEREESEHCCERGVMTVRCKTADRIFIGRETEWQN